MAGLLPAPSISFALLNGDNLPNLIDGTPDADAINGLGGSDTLNGAAGNDTISGGAAADTLDGGEGNDDLSGNGGDDDISGGLGADTLTGGNGNDTYRDAVGDTIVEGAGAGTDIVIVSATFSLSGISNVENLTLTGAGNYNATGNSLANLLTGNLANNRFRGGGGADTLIGGLGNDTYIDPTGAVIQEFSGEGTDTVESLATFSLSGISHVENLTLTGASNANATGNSYDNLIIGNTAINRLRGSEGTDTLMGGQGNDTYVDPTGDIITELAGEGTDTVESAATFTLSGIPNVENIILTGVGNFNATGNSLGNVLTGNADNNRFRGGDGADTLIGGLGNDTYIDPLGDTIQEFSGEGTDTVESVVTFTLSGISHVENLSLTGADNINATGNSYANILTGNAGNNRLRGGDGIDTLLGGAGNDTYVDFAGDVITELSGEGTDTVEVEATFSLSGFNFVESVLLLGVGNFNATGNSYANLLTGNIGNNRFRGGDGADTLAGGLGDDTYIDPAGDTIQEFSAQGIDTVESVATFSLSGISHVENLILTGVDNINGTGNSYANVITGNGGGNRLRGGGGADTLIGGLGDDTYIDPAGTTIVELVSEGIDTVESGVTFTLFGLQQVERLTLTGVANINGTGNSYANLLIGNSGNNLLSGEDNNDELIGGAGNDTLNGGAGADTLRGGVGNDIYNLDQDDVFDDQPGEGTDTIISTTYNNLTNLDNTENLTLLDTGEDASLMYGNDLANVMIGNSSRNDMQGRDGNDTLIGGAGQDTLIGGAGADRLEGGTGTDYFYVDSSDTVIEVDGEGTDNVQASGSFVLAAGQSIEGMSFSAFTGDFNLTGNEFSQFLSGNSGANRLEGMGGSDTLSGGDGIDTYVYSSSAHSTGVNFDLLNYVDLDIDRIDLPSLPGSLNAVASGNLFLATFDSDLAAAVDGALNPNGAVQFTPSFSDNDLGGFGRFYLVVDRNNDGSYTAGLDIVIKFDNYTGTLGLDDFV